MSDCYSKALEEACAHQVAGRLKDAERICGDVLQRDPANADSWHRLGRVALERNELRAAAACVLQAILRNPEIPSFHVSLGEILEAQGRPRQAALCYRATLRLAPGDVPALTRMGNVLRAHGRTGEAIWFDGEARRVTSDLSKCAGTTELSIQGSASGVDKKQ